MVHANGPGPARGLQLLLEFKPEPVCVVRASDVVGSDPAVRLCQHDGKRVGDSRVAYFTLEQGLLLLEEVKHGWIFGSSAARL